MIIRKVSDYGVREAARTILNDCFDKGCSKYWSGDKEEFGELRKLCAKFSIFYVCDFNGEFQLIEDKEQRTLNELILISDVRNCK